MEKLQLIEKLIQFGLTRQEASVYICLFMHSELTGYEAAKLTGISRSNVYNALAGLAEKGAAYIIEGTASKYVAVAAEEFCDNRLRRLNEDKQYITENMPKAVQVSEGYITIEGYRHILDKMHHMLRLAEQRIYISGCYEVLRLIEEELQNALDRGLKVVIITDEKPVCPDAVVYLSQSKDRQVRLITDSKYVMTGEINGNNNDTCLYSGQKNFVNVFKEALRNEMKLIEYTKGEKYNE